MTAARRQKLAASWLLVLAVVLALVAAACAEKPTPRFPHRVHLTELECDAPGKPACLTCNSCHAPSRPEREYKLPAVALCQNCHRGESRASFASLQTVPERPFGEIAIDHDRHLAMPSIGGQCVSCHEGVVSSDKSTLPPMERCFQCHEHEQQWAKAECGPCHQSKDLARSLPQTFLRHDAAFLRHHGKLEMFEKNLCRSCHTQRDCQSCHDVTQDLTAEQRRPERVESTSFHRGDFMSRHALEASASPTRCATCHAPETCDSCHVASGVSGNAERSRNPHPPGWVTNATDARSAHGVEARRDIVACASCHDQGPATNCIRCHQVGGYGGNPHPRGWQSSRSPRDQMCRYCHER